MRLLELNHPHALEVLALWPLMLAVAWRIALPGASFFPAEPYPLVSDCKRQQRPFLLSWHLLPSR